jgi:alpha-tubulin suppressor-like RCC1 family protein
VNGEATIGETTEKLGKEREMPLAFDEVAIKIESGMDHNIVLTSSGRAFAWGMNGQNQLGVGYAGTFHMWPLLVQFVDPHDPTPPFITKIHAKHDCSFFISDDGRLFSAGSNFYGQMADGTDEEYADFKAHRVGGDLLHQRVVDVACSSQHVVALTETHKVFSWGSATLTKTPILGLESEQVEAKRMFLRDLASSWKDDAEMYSLAQAMQEGDSKHYAIMTPTQVHALDGLKVSSVVCGDEHTICLTEEGAAFGFGSNTSFQLGPDLGGVIQIPTRLPILEGHHTTLIAAGFNFSFALINEVSSPF